MHEATETELRLIRTARGGVELWSPTDQRIIKASARVGTWGIGVGTALILLSPFGLHVPMHGLWIGTTLTLGGTAAVLASAAILRKVWKGRRLRHLTAAGVLGIPFGISAAAFGIGWLLPDPAMRTVAMFATPVLVMLGVVLTVLFGSGSLKLFWRSLGVEAEDPQGESEPA